MSAAGLETIPYELFFQICGYLTDDLCSLQCLALTSKAVHTAVLPTQFYRFELRVQSRSQLKEDVNCIPKRAVDLVRHLVITGRMPPAKCDTKYGLQGDPGDEYIFTPPETIYEEDAAWTPLAGLLEQIPSLKELNYNSKNQFPPCLLSVLHSNHPSSRLHVGSFRIRSVNCLELDEHEMALVTSPCLYSINLNYVGEFWFAGSRIKDHNASVIRDVVLLATNLREVGFVNRSVRRSRPVPAQTPSKYNLPYRGLGTSYNLPFRNIGKIQALNIGGGSDFLKAWEFLDFSQLCKLHFSESSLIPYEELCQLSRDHQFHSLQSLQIYFRYVNWWPGVTRTQYYEACCEFLRHIPPLQSLKILGQADHSISDVIILRHGSTLRQLELPIYKRATLSPEQVETISASCRFVESLTIQLPWTGGNNNEVLLYQSLGQLPNLRSLFLTLDGAQEHYTDWDDTVNRNLASTELIQADPDFDDFDLEPFSNSRKIRNGHIRKAFIRSAVDGNLARSLFQAVSNSKSKNGSPFQMLRLRSTRTYAINSRYEMARTSSYVIWNIAEFLGGWYQVERKLGGGHEDELIVKETKRSDTDWDSIFSEKKWNPNGSVERVFRKIWPETKKKDWRLEWYSYPLCSP
jgi:hypothetical protein